MHIKKKQKTHVCLFFLIFPWVIFYTILNVSLIIKFRWVNKKKIRVTWTWQFPARIAAWDYVRRPCSVGSTCTLGSRLSLFPCLRGNHHAALISRSSPRVENFNRVNASRGCLRLCAPEQHMTESRDFALGFELPYFTSTKKTVMAFVYLDLSPRDTWR